VVGFFAAYAMFAARIFFIVVAGSFRNDTILGAHLDYFLHLALTFVVHP